MYFDVENDISNAITDGQLMGSSSRKTTKPQLNWG